MKRTRSSRNLLLAALALGLAGAAGCSSSIDPQSPGSDPIPEESVLDRSWPAMAAVDWGHVDLSDPDVLRKFAKADFVVLETAYLWRDGLYDDALDELRTLNPDIKVVGYVNAHGSWLSWGEIDRSEGEHYTWDWYQATREYWSFTTTGDTMCSWPGKVLLDILDPDCRASMVQVLADHWHSHGSTLDGIFWDHFNDFLWVPTTIPGVDGQMDLDGDGIAHRDDPDEMQAYRDASADLVRRARAALGGDVIQVANGQRAPADSTFAALLDGMFYEEFPEYNWSSDKMRKALDPTVPNNLFAARNWPRTVNGGPWLILSNRRMFTAYDEGGQLVEWRRAEFNRVIAALTGATAVYYDDSGAYRYGWPEVEVELGLPLGGAVIDGTVVSREFERGRVVLDFAGADYTVPFDFAIVQQDSLRQHYDMEDFQP